MAFTWIDWTITIIVIYFAFRGWTEGVLALAASLLSFFLSLYLALRLESFVSSVLIKTFGLSPTWAGIAAYIGIAFLAESIISIFTGQLLQKVPSSFTKGLLSQLLGAGLSALNGLVLITFFLILVMALPLRGTISQDIQSSTIPPILFKYANLYGGNIRLVIENSAQELTKFITVEPSSTDRVQLDEVTTEKDLRIDQTSEQGMLTLVNQERTSRGIAPVTMDIQMQEVARAYSKELLLGRYFSHIDMQGHDVAYRFQQAGIPFSLVGENLAYAPSLKIAHMGLMNSEGHKRNILDTRFHRIGIGVIDAGPWGKMFTQEFAD